MSKSTLSAFHYLFKISPATPRLVAPGGIFILEHPFMPALFADALFLRLSFARPALFCALVFGLGSVQAAPTGLLNDTGQTQCANASDVMVACDSATAGAAGTRPGQDGRFGRDVASPAKVGGGAAGFDFTKICFNGDAQGAGTCTGALLANTTGTATGSASTDWACTRDNVTNLVWSLRTQIATWNAATVATYPNAGHNSASRCGFNSGWRLPTRRELLSIVHNGLTAGPSIDASYFPATQSGYHWTSEVYLPQPIGVWVLLFDNGSTTVETKTYSNYVRLVRSGQ